MCVRTQSCLTFCNPMDCSSPGFSVHGILQARILEWVAISYSGDLPNPGIEPMSLASPELAGRHFSTVLPGPHASLLFSKLLLNTYYVHSVSFLKEFFFSFLKEFKYTQIQKNDRPKILIQCYLPPYKAFY